MVIFSRPNPVGKKREFQFETLGVFYLYLNLDDPHLHSKKIICFKEESESSTEEEFYNLNQKNIAQTYLLNFSNQYIVSY